MRHGVMGTKHFVKTTYRRTGLLCERPASPSNVSPPGDPGTIDPAPPEEERGPVACAVVPWGWW
jgi:hypothetical protein